MNKESIAFSICQKLKENGYTAYYAGGYVRDLLLNVASDDIDIATDASCETIQSLFEKTIPIGISFGIVVVVEKKHSFEVATFRKDVNYKDGRRPSEVSFCDPKEDAFRRDFTINGMFYDPIEKKVIDYVGGQEDLKKKIIKAIGDPHLRFQEDRLRMIRAVRFSARLNYTIEPNTKKAILKHAKELFPSVSIERVYQEFQKMKNHHFAKALELMHEMGLLTEVFPTLRSLNKHKFKHLAKAFEALSQTSPTILYLLLLFPNLSATDLEEIIDYLKVSNEKAKLAFFSLSLKKALEKSLSDYEWVLFLSDSNFELAFCFATAHLSEDNRKKIFNTAAHLKKKLAKHIQRKIDNKSVVDSKFLMDHGVSAGPKLGKLLVLAEKICIEKDLSDPHKALKDLQSHSLWNS